MRNPCICIYTLIFIPLSPPSSLPLPLSLLYYKREYYISCLKFETRLLNSQESSRYYMTQIIVIIIITLKNEIRLGNKIFFSFYN